MTECKALLADVKRLAVHDGPGLRTTFFLKGCPLRCRWCHNPECQEASPELLYRKSRCQHCGACAAICPTHAHTMEGGSHLFQRERCILCGRCVDACRKDALRLCGRRLDVPQAVALAREDCEFYRQSGGGVTLSGGEPMLQWRFCQSFFAALGKEHIHRALDTCGAIPWRHYEAILPVVDLILYDVKQIDSAVHQRDTGQPNQQILENLRRLNQSGIPMEIRMPLIPGCNLDDDTTARTAEFLAALPYPPPVRLLPYHSLAHSKYEACGHPDTLPGAPTPTAEELAHAARLLQARGLTVCRE